MTLEVSPLERSWLNAPLERSWLNAATLPFMSVTLEVSPLERHWWKATLPFMSVTAEVSLLTTSLCCTRRCKCGVKEQRDDLLRQWSTLWLLEARRSFARGG
jgi:hypothetical protein